jgi:hypothetical protein
LKYEKYRNHRYQAKLKKYQSLLRAISVSLFDIGFGDFFYQILKEHRNEYK